MSIYFLSSRINKPMAVVLILLGILCIALPFVSGIALTFVIACSVALAGIAHLALAFKHQHVGSRLWHILAGLVLMVGGIVLAAMPLDAMASFTLVIACLFVMAGLMRIFGWFAIRSVHGAIWMLIDGIVTTLIGTALVAMWPSSSLWTIGTLAGVNFIFSGFAALQGSGRSR